MGAKVQIDTDDAPKPLGPYSQAIKVGDHLFVSGQIGIDPLTGEMAGRTTGEQTQQILQNIDSILLFTGSSMGQIVRLVVYMIDINEINIVNEIFEEVFTYLPPARTTVQVAALPKGARIEIEATSIAPPPHAALG